MAAYQSEDSDQRRVEVSCQAQATCECRDRRRGFALGRESKNCWVSPDSEPAIATWRSGETDDTGAAAASSHDRREIHAVMGGSGRGWRSSDDCSTLGQESRWNSGEHDQDAGRPARGSSCSLREAAVSTVARPRSCHQTYLGRMTEAPSRSEGPG